MGMGVISSRMITETFHFKIGDFHCIAINDGYVNNIPVHEFFSGAPPGELQAACDRHDLPPTNMVIPIIVLFVDTGKHQILIDTGGGRHDNKATVGWLSSRMKFEGIKPEDIDIVALSHGHWDHVGGNTLPSGVPAFPNARYVIPRSEYTYWVTEEPPAEIPLIYKNLIYIREQLDLIEAGEEIIPGLQAVPAPGHTLHHTAFRISSNGETLYCLMDIIDHPIHFEHVDWTPSWDMQPLDSVRSRRELFRRASSENALVHGFHLPFPGLGHIVETGSSWRFEPITTW